MDRESRSGLRVFVGDHVEVEGRFSVVLHNGLVNDRARARVDDRRIVAVRHLLEEASRDPLVDEHVKDLRVIVRLEALDRVEQLAVRALKLHDLVLEGWTADTVAEDNDLAWDAAIALSLEVLQGLKHEVAEDVSRLLGLVPLDILSRVCTAFTDELLVEQLMSDHAEVLRSVWGGRGGEAYDRGVTLVAHIDADEHRVECADLVGQCDPVKVHRHFGVHLAQQIGPDAHFTTEVLLQRFLEHELRDNAAAVKIFFDVLFLLRLRDDHKADLQLRILQGLPFVLHVSHER